ncbi:hypothetical protein [Leucobacter sp. cx-169]|uniref:hypothetical protein n=1 Tax=Leucobacter sp. cx-169 TaxID=2770549 RepID=UPI00165E1EA4|nr:hypothetical protein [Leucobacter sp. cx-169]MBC9927396.1 hypothetical protein [Leucobacter sp. cx-169]
MDDQAELVRVFEAIGSEPELPRLAPFVSVHESGEQLQFAATPDAGPVIALMFPVDGMWSAAVVDQETLDSHVGVMLPSGLDANILMYAAADAYSAMNRNANIPVPIRATAAFTAAEIYRRISYDNHYAVLNTFDWLGLRLLYRQSGHEGEGMSFEALTVVELALMKQRFDSLITEHPFYLKRHTEMARKATAKMSDPFLDQHAMGWMMSKAREDIDLNLLMNINDPWTDEDFVNP